MSPLTYTLGTGAVDYDLQIGWCAHLLQRSAVHRRLPMVYIQDRMAPAVRHQQILFVFDSYQQRVGLITWAFVADDIKHRLLKDPFHILHESEWNEGGTLFLMDFLAPFGHAREIVRMVKASYWHPFTHALAMRRKPTTPDRARLCTYRRRLKAD